ncbi:MAG: hypothetical protein AABX36_05890 [Candidatus Thermoplasmatota archaeon]
MSEKRFLAILGFLLALIGGILVLRGALSLPRGGNLDLSAIAERAVEGILGVAAILGGVYMYRGRMSTGGLATLVIGIAIMIVTRSISLDAVLVAVGGALGIIGAEART